MSFLDLLLSPYRTHKKRRLLEKEFKKRDSVNMKALEEEQILLMIERDFDEIAEEYLDNGKYEDVTIRCSKSNMPYLEKYLNKQGFDCILLDEERILVRS